jgi:hypothetical protein
MYVVKNLANDKFVKEGSVKKECYTANIKKARLFATREDANNCVYSQFDCPVEISGGGKS